MVWANWPLYTLVPFLWYEADYLWYEADYLWYEADYLWYLLSVMTGPTLRTMSGERMDCGNERCGIEQGSKYMNGGFFLDQ
jgi:hypothetical protein